MMGGAQHERHRVWIGKSRRRILGKDQKPDRFSGRPFSEWVGHRVGGYHSPAQRRRADESSKTNPPSSTIEPTAAASTAPDSSGWSYSAAEHDHRAFTFWRPQDLPEEDPLLGYLGLPVTLEDWTSARSEFDDYRYFSGIIVDEVREAEGFEELGRVSHSNLAVGSHCGAEPTCAVQDYFWYTEMRRSTFIGCEESAEVGCRGYLYAISNLGLTASTMDALSEPLAEVLFTPRIARR